MNFDDRLRNHLQEQTNELTVTREGVDGVRARSRRRKQRRAGAATFSVAALAVVGALVLLGPNNEEANLATDGDAAVENEDQSPSATTFATTPSNEPIEAEIALPEPGSALVLTAANNTVAPGGYNVARSGRADGVYFVVSTAPGSTIDETVDGGYQKPDTIYTFDGDTWTNSAISDRYVSGFDTSNSGVLYAVSTGSPTSSDLAIGQSSNGADWEWTTIDLTGVFGEDKSTWPAYAVQQTIRDNERLVVVTTSGRPNVEAAFTLATDAGADIESVNQVTDVNASGIAWYVEPEIGECAAMENEQVNALYDAEPEGPEFDYSRELTKEEQAELEAYWEAQLIRGKEIRLQALATVATAPGCDAYVDCATDQAQRDEVVQAEIAASLAELGILTDGSQELTEEQAMSVDEIYGAGQARLEAWFNETDCAEVLGWSIGGEGEEDLTMASSSWEDLGVTPPASWKPANAAFLVDGSLVTSLGDVFVGQEGYLAAVDVENNNWRVVFDTTNYDGEEITPTQTSWTSEDGDDWSSTPINWTYGPDTRLSNGITLTNSWTDTGSELLRTNADGTTNTLELADLAPDLDTTGYSIVNVTAGQYGAVAWAVNWSELETGGNYNSIVLYTPDGTGWGATAVPDAEVVQVIVGTEDVLIFLNNPNRTEGTAQPILLGK